jgi:nickel/cobalt transporter (NicO) family protein
VKARLGAAAVLALAFSMAFASPASAHPLGNFSVNRYSRIEVGPESTTVRYVLDLAEIPTIEVLQAAGLPTDAPADEVARRVLAARAAQLAGGVRLTMGGRAARWEIRDSSLVMPPGQAGLRTLRISLSLVAALTVRAGDAVSYQDTNERGRAGWHEIVMRGVDGVTLAESSVPARDRSDELRQYPADPTLSPPGLDQATARVGTFGAEGAAARSAERAPSATRLGIDVGADRIAAFLGHGTDADPLALLLALAVAAAFGAFHALGPGHGKTLVGAYLVGSRGTPLHAVLLGATVTVTHTAGVYVLGLVTLVAARYVLPERVFPVIGLVSGLLVLGVGLSMARARWRAWSGRPRPDHRHDHGDAPGHGHDHEHGHVHDGAPQRLSLRSLLALGVSGGLLPCPTALVVLLAAISFHDVALGMALVAAFSVGLATVLTSIGLLVVAGRRALSRSRSAGRLRSWPALRVVPVLSAVAIAAAGLVIALDAIRTLA